MRLPGQLRFDQQVSCCDEHHDEHHDDRRRYDEHDLDFYDDAYVHTGWQPLQHR